MSTDPIKLHNIEKACINMMNCPRSLSARRSRNPILEGEEPSSAVPSKARVPAYLTEIRKVTDRPRGIGKSVYSNQLFESFNIGNDPVIPYKPFKRQIEKPIETQTQNYVPTKKVFRPQTPGRNPILQDETFERPVVYSKKQGYPELPSRVVCEETISPAVTYSKQSSYSRRNSSSVFCQDDSIDIFGTHKRPIQERQATTNSIIQYKYALPYRDLKVTEKLV